MSTPVIDKVLVREIEARADRLAADEFIEFFYAGAPAVGHFCCVACGRGVTCVGLLPPCACGSRLWEHADTSPFTATELSQVPDTDYEQWLEEDRESTARALAGIWLAVPLGLVVWAFVATVVAVMWAMIR